MAPKRKRNVKTVPVPSYNNLSLNDVLCPICRSILIEPVTLPCNHGFCSACLEGTVANANLVCPLCRVRIASWLRKSSKNGNKLINNNLWNVIQRLFPAEVKKKLAGVEEYHEEAVSRCITAPGEIRREYEIQKAKEILELQKEREAQCKASEEYIKRIKEQEELEEKMCHENMLLSEQVARKLVQEYAYDPGPSCAELSISSSSKHSHNLKKLSSIDKAIKKMNDHKMVSVKPVNDYSPKQYFCKVLCQDQKKESSNENNHLDKAGFLKWKVKDKLKRTVTEASDSSDSIVSECRYFKPIEQKFRSMLNKSPIIKVPALVASANTVIIGPPKGKTSLDHAVFGSAFVFTRPSRDVLFTEKLSSTDPCTSHSIAALSSVHSTKECLTNFVDTCTESAGNKSPASLRNEAEKAFITPLKRKPISSPLEVVTIKKCKAINNANAHTQSFVSYEIKNLDEVNKKKNGSNSPNTISISNVVSPYEASTVRTQMQKLQEKEDLKLAQQLHNELNKSRRNIRRNNIKVHNMNENSLRKAARQNIFERNNISQC